MDEVFATKGFMRSNDCGAQEKTSVYESSRESLPHLLDAAEHLCD
jgi:hypothetical protein